MHVTNDHGCHHGQRGLLHQFQSGAQRTGDSQGHGDGDSTRNEISDQGQVVVEAAVTGYRDSNDLSESVRADIQAADRAFRDAIRAIPSTTSTASEATQAYKDAMDTYNTSIDGVRASQDC